jgi:hypothetical protein
MSDWKDLKKRQLGERKQLRKSRSLKSINPFRIVGEVRNKGSDEYKSNISKGLNARKAEEISKIAGIGDKKYIEYILNEIAPGNISISEFIYNAKNGEYEGLSNQRRPQYNSRPQYDYRRQYNSRPQYDYRRQYNSRPQYDDHRQYDDSRQYDDLIDILKEIKTGSSVKPGPSEGMFKAMVGDYAHPGTSMSKGKSELAKFMDRYAQLTNKFNVSKVNFENKLNMLKDSWGDSLDMGYEEREEQFDPFLRGNIPLMEVKSKNYENY